MKAILVIDMPDECPECPLCENRNVYCLPAKKDVDDFENGIPSWCPLRPMPARKEVHYTDPFFGEVENLTNIGYNRCLIDLGETE